jgi:hypothetical protein
MLGLLQPAACAPLRSLAVAQHLHETPTRCPHPPPQLPTDEVITPPIPIKWSMWYMGYAPNGAMQRSLELTFTNITQLVESERVRV